MAKIKDGVTSADTEFKHFHTFCMTSEIDGFTTNTYGKIKNHVHKIVNNEVQKEGGHDHEIRKLYG